MNTIAWIASVFAAAALILWVTGTILGHLGDRRLEQQRTKAERTDLLARAILNDSAYAW